jgi:pyruvate dehydrogenase E2 component (dihydrolipoamide acetyltransferase)
MPKAGMAMEEGQIIRWLKKEGDTVETGEPILEIETDKVAMEVEAERSGVLLKITRGDGETVPVTETIGYIGEEGEELPTEEAPAAGAAGGEAGAGTAGADGAEAGTAESGAAESAGAAATAETRPSDTSESATGKPKATPWARTLAERHGIDLSTVQATGPHGEIKGRDVEEAAAAGTGARAAGGAAGGAAGATPVARRVAEQKGVDLATVTGTGPQGRITKDDVLSAAERGAAAPGGAAPGGPAAKKAVGPAAGGPSAEGESTRFTSMRRTIARNMLQSHQNIPPVTLNGYADVTQLLELRRELNEEDPQHKLSVNDFVLKATVESLRRHPGLNATADMEKEEVTSYGTVNLGVAVALPDGLIVPVIENAETLSLRGLGAQVRELAAAARNRSLGPDRLSGATFTVTNLGMYGVTTFTPIINPPQVGILGVGSIEEQLHRASDGTIGERKTMGLSLTIDHRIIDGAQGAEFLATLRTLLEHPVRFLAA